MSEAMVEVGGGWRWEADDSLVAGQPYGCGERVPWALARLHIFTPIVFGPCATVSVEQWILAEKLNIRL